MGGSVAPGPMHEIGWTYIWSERPDIVGNGPWFQFHYDRWVVPPGAVEIARSPIASQAFIINRTLALQFHPELTSEALDSWLVWGGDDEVEKVGQDPAVLLAQTKAEDAAAQQRTFDLIDNFIEKVVKA
jgi:GMP synthase-like glutamine amidotransferase